MTNKPTLIQYLREAQVTIIDKLSQHQRKVLSIVLMAPNSKVHDEQITADRNMSAAVEFLVKSGSLSKIEGDQLQITDRGREIAESEGLTDSGILTKSGSEIAST